jgi:hypothetical protein
MRRLAAVYFTYLLAAHFLVGCAALGVPAADTFNKKAAGAVQTVNAASKITPDENDAYIDRCEEAQSAIDLTRQLYVTDPTGATDRLAQIIAGLTVLTAELERRR